MKRLVLGAVAMAAAGWIGAAQAADLPYAPHAPYTVNQPLNVYSWAGPYLGGNLGYAWGSVDNNPTRPSGFSGGVQGGYNWQTGSVLGPLVFGVEADIQGGDLRDSYPALFGFSTNTYSQKIDWFATARGRIGLATGPVLSYVTGGYAYGDVKTTGTETPLGGGAPFGFSTSNGRSGWTYGSGVEAALGGGWTGMAPGGSSAGSPAEPGSPRQSGRTRSGTPSSPRRWMRGCRCATCRKPPPTLTRVPP